MVEGCGDQDDVGLPGTAGVGEYESAPVLPIVGKQYSLRLACRAGRVRLYRDGIRRGLEGFERAEIEKLLELAIEFDNGNARRHQVGEVGLGENESGFGVGKYVSDCIRGEFDVDGNRNDACPHGAEHGGDEFGSVE